MRTLPSSLLQQARNFVSAAAAAGAPLALYVDRGGRLQWCGVDSPRHRAWLASSDAARVVGVFDASADPFALCAEARAV